MAYDFLQCIIKGNELLHTIAGFVFSLEKQVPYGFIIIHKLLVTDASASGTSWNKIVIPKLTCKRFFWTPLGPENVKCQKMSIFKHFWPEQVDWS